MQLYKVLAGQVVLSKIDLKNGALAVLPERLSPSAVTSHFAVYDLSPDLHPEYLQRVIQTPVMKDLLWRSKVGAEGRKEVKLKSFEAMRIPYPPLSTQLELLKPLFSARADVSSAQSALDEYIDSVSAHLHEISGMSADMLKARRVEADFRLLQAWSIDAGRASMVRRQVRDCAPLGNLIEEKRELFDPSAFPEVLWRMHGVSNSRGVFSSGLIQGRDFTQKQKRVDGGVFIHNPTRANVGSIGRLYNAVENALTSPEYVVWRARRPSDGNFLDLLRRTKYFQSLVPYFRVGAVKRRLSFEQLALIPVPALPPERRVELGARFEELRQKLVYSRVALASRNDELAASIMMGSW